MKEKIGIGITTCNRPHFFEKCIESIDLNSVDHVVVVNDGKPFEYTPSSDKITFIQNPENIGISKSKNKILKKLLEFDCEHIFTLEDDCVITNNEVFQKYIDAYKETGIKHFNFGPGSPWNRVQDDPSIIGDLSKRQLATQESPANPKMVINYKNNVSISLYQHIVAMFCYFHKSALDKAGLLDEEFYNAWEHVEHTYRIIQNDEYTPFWWFADITGSENYIKEAQNEKAQTSLAKDESTFMRQVEEGLKVFYKKHNIVPAMIQDNHTQDDIKNILRNIKIKSQLKNVIDIRIQETQYLPEFDILLDEFKKLKAKNVLEIGSYFGWSLRHWLELSEFGSKVISVDLPISKFCGPSDPRCKKQEHIIENEWRNWTKKNKNKLSLIQDFSQHENTKQKVIELLNGSLLDFAFIDGDHRYEAVKQDFEMYSSLIRSGGIIALHDIGYAEEGGVHKLWDELKDNFQHIELRKHPKNEKGIGIIFMP